MPGEMKYQAIVVAGGKGLRMGGSIPKQFVPVGGRPVLMRTLERLYASLRKLQHFSEKDAALFAGGAASFPDGGSGAQPAGNDYDRPDFAVGAHRGIHGYHESARVSALYFFITAHYVHRGDGGRKAPVDAHSAFRKDMSRNGTRAIARDSVAAYGKDDDLRVFGQKPAQFRCYVFAFVSVYSYRVGHNVYY